MSGADTIYAKLKSAPPAMVAEVLDFVEFLESRSKAESPLSTPASGWETFFGRLKNEPIVEGDPVEAQRTLRDEWA